MSADSTAIPELTPIPDWPGYFLSRSGQLWSIKKPGGNGGVYKTPRRLKLQRRGNYLKATLKDGKAGRELQILMHQLMLAVFVGPCPVGLEGCHENGNEHDNDIDNLRWDTRKSNMNDKIIHGTIAKGEGHGSAILTEQEVHAIRAFRAVGKRHKWIAAVFNVSVGCVRDVLYGATWKWLS